MENNKDWKGNKTSIVSTSGFHNLSNHERDPLDFYATSPEALKKLLNYEKFCNVWECAVGNGHLAEVLKDNNMLGKVSDLYIRNYPCEQIDFLKFEGTWDGDIVTNPPYKWATQFVYKALEVVTDSHKVAMIFPQRYLSSKSRYKLFTGHPPKIVYALSSRIACALNGNFTGHSSSAVDYLWIIWEKGQKKGDTVLKWIL
jgi:hypothetical protein